MRLRFRLGCAGPECARLLASKVVYRNLGGHTNSCSKCLFLLFALPVRIQLCNPQSVRASNG